MSKLTYKISYYVLYAIFAVILIVLGLFYFGGQMSSPLVPGMSNPAHTDTLLYMIYGLFAFTILITLVTFIAQFGSALKDSPMDALKSLGGVILLVIVLVVAWSMGSDEPLVIVGYEGTENVPFWLKLSDMFLYSLYFLFGVAVVAMILSGIKKLVS